MKEVSSKQELIRWIMQACASCPYLRENVECDRKKSQCHSERVKKWLKELDELEEMQKQSAGAREEVADGV